VKGREGIPAQNKTNWNDLSRQSPDHLLTSTGDVDYGELSRKGKRIGETPERDGDRTMCLTTRGLLSANFLWDVARREKEHGERVEGIRVTEMGD